MKEKKVLELTYSLGYLSRIPSKDPNITESAFNELLKGNLCYSTDEKPVIIVTGLSMNDLHIFDRPENPIRKHLCAFVETGETEHKTESGEIAYIETHHSNEGYLFGKKIIFVSVNSK